MKENINEHDMTKKMMNIIRNSQKPLIKEADEVPAPMAAPVAEPQNAMVPGDDPQEEPEMGKSPINGSHEPIKGNEENFDSSYIELEQSTQSFKKLEQQLREITSAFSVTSIYISEGRKDIIINGLVTENCRFTMWLSQDDVEIDGQIDSNSSEIIDKLKRFRDTLVANRMETEKDYIINNPDIDKNTEI